MSSEDIRATLAGLPENIRDVLNNSEISPSVENLLNALEPDHIPDQDRTFLYSYLDWMMYVFATAREPLARGTLSKIRSVTNNLINYIHNNNWDHIRDHLIPELLAELSSIPARRSRQAIDLAEFDRSREAALRQITASQHDAQRAQESTEASLKDSQEAFEAKVTDGLRAIREDARSYSQQLAELLEDVQEQKSDASAEIGDLLSKLQKEYGFVASQVLGEAHGKAAAVEQSTADAHKKRARNYSLGAAITAVLVIAQDRVAQVLGWTNDWDQWFDIFRSLPVLGSPVAILIFLAIREGQSAKSHSATHVRWQSLELQLKSWEPYLSTLSEDTRVQMEKVITPKLFVGDVGATHLPTQE